MIDITLPDGSVVKGLDARRASWSWWNINKDGDFSIPGKDPAGFSAVIDAGANVGLFARWVLSNSPSARVWSFEPVPAIAECLERNLDGYAGRGKAIRAALGDRSGDQSIRYYPRANDESSTRDVDRARAYESTLENWEARMKVYAPGWRNLPKLFRPLAARVMLSARYKSRKVKTKTMRLSDFLARERIDRVDLLKVDAAGSEWAILYGVDERDWPKVGAVALAVSDGSDPGMRERVKVFLEGKGFKVVDDEAGEMDAVGRGVLKAIRA